MASPARRVAPRNAALRRARSSAPARVAAAKPVVQTPTPAPPSARPPQALASKTEARQVGLVTTTDLEAHGRAAAAAAAAEGGTGTRRLDRSADGASTSEPGAGGGLLERFSGDAVRGFVLLNIGAALFGSNQVAIKVVEEGGLNPNELQLGRFAVAAAAFAPFAWRGFRDPAVRSAALELGVYLFAGYFTQAEGLEITTASRGAFTGTFTVLAVPLLTGLTGGRVPLSIVLASATALLGVGLLTNSGGDPNLGDAWCIASAVLFGVHKFRTEKRTAQLADRSLELIGCQLSVLAGLALISESPELLEVAAGGPDAIAASLSGAPWLPLLYMGLATTAFTLYTEVEALKSVSATMAALIYTAEPLWGAGFAYALLGERWGATGWVGAFLIVASSLSAQYANAGEGEGGEAGAKEA